MKKEDCQSCFKNKTAIKCSECEDPTCKSCSYFIDDTVFEFAELLPETVKDKTFCTACYHKVADPVLEQYREYLERAKNVNVYSSIQGTETGLIKRIAKPIVIKDCADREETLMRMAFYAAQKGYDTLVDVDIKSAKVGKGTYKKLMWAGTGIPVDPKIKK